MTVQQDAAGVRGVPEFHYSSPPKTGGLKEGSETVSRTGPLATIARLVQPLTPPDEPSHSLARCGQLSWPTAPAETVSGGRPERRMLWLEYVASSRHS